MVVNKIIVRVTLGLSILLFIASLTQDCFCTRDCYGSLMVLLVGVLGMLMELGALISTVTDFFDGQSASMDYIPGATFAWLANPMVVMSWVFLFKKDKISLAMGMGALLMALSFLAFDKVPGDEAGNYYKITGYALGYWLWLSSALVVVLGNLVLGYGGKAMGISANR